MEVDASVWKLMEVLEVNGIFLAVNRSRWKLIEVVGSRNGNKWKSIEVDGSVLKFNRSFWK